LSVTSEIDKVLEKVVHGGVTFAQELLDFKDVYCLACLLCRRFGRRRRWALILEIIIIGFGAGGDSYRRACVGCSSCIKMHPAGDRRRFIRDGMKAECFRSLKIFVVL